MKKVIISFSLLFFTSMLFFSCEEAVLGESPKSSPEDIFEMLWTDFDEHYGLFEARGWNWDSIYTVYRPQVSNQTSDEELWSIFENMISYLDDSHTAIFNYNLYNPETSDPDDYSDWVFVSGSEENDLVKDEFSLDLLRDKYLANIEDLDLTPDIEDENYFIGNVKDKSIGYIYLSIIKADNENFMDDVLKKIGMYDAIILDIRNNNGGEDEIGASIAGRFADGSYPAFTVQTRNGPNHTDFSEPVLHSAEIQGQENYSKPVIILTDKITVSAAETMLFHFKTFDSVTQIGDATAGDISDLGMRRFLPNGWQYQYSIMQYLQPDGTSLDGIGHIPSIQVRNSIANIEAEEDKVIERAIEYLFEEYGIE